MHGQLKRICEVVLRAFVLLPTHAGLTIQCQLSPSTNAPGDYSTGGEQQSRDPSRDDDACRHEPIGPPPWRCFSPLHVGEQEQFGLTGQLAVNSRRKRQPPPCTENGKGCYCCEALRQSGSAVPAAGWPVFSIQLDSVEELVNARQQGGEGWILLCDRLQSCLDIAQIGGDLGSRCRWCDRSRHGRGASRLLLWRQACSGHGFPRGNHRCIRASRRQGVVSCVDTRPNRL